MPYKGIYKKMGDRVDEEIREGTRKRRIAAQKAAEKKKKKKKKGKKSDGVKYY